MGKTANSLKDSSYSHSIKKLLPWILYAILPIALFRLYYHPSHFLQSSTSQLPHLTISSSSSHPHPPPQEEELKKIEPPCDYTEGNWVNEKVGPLYNGSTCGTIKEGQNCIAHGRSDLGYLYWRWKPKKCHLPRFEPLTFLHLLKNKHLAFIGDSLARNQLESLLCMLSSASPPSLIYTDSENKFRRWKFSSHNFTISIYWSPFLVKGVEKSNSGPNYNKLYLDQVDEKWAVDMGDLDMILLSIGHWFLHPAVYYEGESVIGCHYCPGLNHTEIGFYDVLRKAIKTTLNATIETKAAAKGKKMDVIVTTFSPSHFEGEWDKAGACPKIEPYKEGEKEVEGMDADMRRIEVEEVEIAKESVKRSVGVRIEALDVTKLALMRGDGHPGPYMHPFPFANGVPDRVQNDCVHWCLPGAIDTWNEILLQIMKNWEGQFSR